MLKRKNRNMVTSQWSGESCLCHDRNVSKNLKLESLNVVYAKQNTKTGFLNTDVSRFGW